ncbi:MAG: shikimate dehydrogenase [Rhodothermaceae bacterium]
MHQRLNHNTKVIAVIGHPIKHSYSPLMQNKAFELKELDYVYLPFDVPGENLKAAIKGMVSLGVKGFNVTLPHKEKINEYLDEISEEASVIGAVNTVVNENGILHGYNTDVNGIIESLNPYKEEIVGQEVSIIGAGGASRSVIYALIRHFKVKRLNIINRTLQIAESLKDYFQTKMLFDNIKTYELVPPDLTRVFRKSKLIVNTTSMGMFPEVDDSATTISKSFKEGQIVFDVIYNPFKTKFLQIAEEQGATVLSGLKMFLEQGAKSFELWTGETMPREEIYEILKQELLAKPEEVDHNE